jgi:hypothetical protein
MTLVPLPALADNYHWMLHDDFRAIGVDPGDDKPASGTLARSALQLPAILVTPRRADDTGRPGSIAHRHPFLRHREASHPRRPRARQTVRCCGQAFVLATLHPWKNDSR